MRDRVPMLPVLVLMLLWAPTWPAAAEEGPDAAADAFAGTYRTRGRTTDVRSGDTRVIEGIVVLAETREGYYSAKAELETKYPSEGGTVDAHVIGTGTGRPSGNAVVGTAETQLVLGAVPGLGAEFAFAPRTVGPRILSTWTAEFRQDGTLIVELENRGGEGEDYSKTRTKLFGSRIADEPSEASRPD